MSISWLKILVYFPRLSVSHTASSSHPGVLSYIRPDGLLHSQSICKCVYMCVCAFLETVSSGMTTSEEVQATLLSLDTVATAISEGSGSQEDSGLCT